MTALVLAQVLRNDIVDRTAQDVINANPVNTFYGNAASSVPAYLYQSLKTLWFSASAVTSAYQTNVVNDLGTGQNSPIGSIVVVSEKIREQAYDRTSFYSDSPGAEVSPVYVLLYKPRAISVNITTIQNASLRVRYLLDNTLRGIQGLYGGVPATTIVQSGDLSVDPRYSVISFYYDNIEPVNSSEGNMVFLSNYVRMYSK